MVKVADLAHFDEGRLSYGLISLSITARPAVGPSAQFPPAEGFRLRQGYGGQVALGAACPP